MSIISQHLNNFNKKKKNTKDIGEEKRLDY